MAKVVIQSPRRAQTNTPLTPALVVHLDTSTPKSNNHTAPNDESPSPEPYSSHTPSWHGAGYLFAIAVLVDDHGHVLPEAQQCLPSTGMVPAAEMGDGSVVFVFSGLCVPVAGLYHVRVDVQRMSGCEEGGGVEVVEQVFSRLVRVYDFEVPEEDPGEFFSFFVCFWCFLSIFAGWRGGPGCRCFVRGGKCC